MKTFDIMYTGSGGFLSSKFFFTTSPASPMVSTKAAFQIPLWATNFGLSTYTNFSQLLPTPLHILSTSKESEAFHVSQLSSPRDYRTWSLCVVVITSYQVEPYSGPQSYCPKYCRKWEQMMVCNSKHLIVLPDKWEKTGI